MLIDCFECGNKVSNSASSCPKCGYAINTSVTSDVANRIGSYIKSLSAAQDLSLTANIVTIICSALIIYSPFMTWLNMGFLEYTGRDKIDDTDLMLLHLGAIVSMLSAIISIAKKKDSLGGVALLSLIISCIVFYIDYRQLQKISDSLADSVGQYLEVGIGNGAYMYAAMTIIAVFSILARMLNKSPKSVS